MSELLAYLLLFASAFGAASVLPFYSEPVLIGMVLLETYSLFLLWTVATLGNTAGAVLNWWLAANARRWQGKRWFPLTPRQLTVGSRWFNRYGVWTLLMAWSPIGGDALTFVAGFLKVRLDVFVVLVGLGKGGRYAAVIWLSQASSQ